MVDTCDVRRVCVCVCVILLKLVVLCFRQKHVNCLMYATLGTLCLCLNSVLPSISSLLSLPPSTSGHTDSEHTARHQDTHTHTHLLRPPQNAM